MNDARRSVRQNSIAPQTIPSDSMAAHDFQTEQQSKLITSDCISFVKNTNAAHTDFRQPSPTLDALQNARGLTLQRDTFRGGVDVVFR